MININLFLLIFSFCLVDREEHRLKSQYEILQSLIKKKLLFPFPLPYVTKSVSKYSVCLFRTVNLFLWNIPRVLFRQFHAYWIHGKNNQTENKILFHYSHNIDYFFWICWMMIKCVLFFNQACKQHFGNWIILYCLYKLLLVSNSLKKTRTSGSFIEG